MSAARVDSAGTVTLLDGKAGPEEVITEQDVQQPAKLVKLLARLLANVATLKRQFAPRRIDFEDVVLPISGDIIQLAHGFRGRVRWWVVGWQGGAADMPILIEETDLTDANTLVLKSYNDGTATIRVESAG